MPELHSCCGLNECKGLGKDGSGTMPGDGKCATTVAHGCAGDNECAGQGGCGYQPSSTTEPAIASANSCKGKGGCASPVGSGDDFKKATGPTCSWTYQEGPFKGQNVWQKGREALVARMEKEGKKVGPSPCCG